MEKLYYLYQAFPPDNENGFPIPSKLIEKHEDVATLKQIAAKFALTNDGQKDYDWVSCISEPTWAEYMEVGDKYKLVIQSWPHSEAE